MESHEDALQTIRTSSSSLNVKDSSRVVLALVRERVGAERGALFVVGEPQGEVRSIVADRVVGDIVLPIAFGIAGAVAQTGQTVDTYNPQHDQRFGGKYDALLNVYDTAPFIGWP